MGVAGTDAPDNETLKILVIDDEKFMRNMLVRLLENLGFQDITEAANGIEGLRIVLEMGHDLSLVICDLDMPSMNGFEFVRLLRALPESSRPGVPVLIVSGHSQEDNVRAIADLGINGFLVKPVTAEELSERVPNAVLSPPIKPAKGTL